MRSRRNLRRGASGERVRWLQEKLRYHGYDVGSVDGKFGYVTEDALINFQRDHGLRSDGIAGARTVYALEHAPILRRNVHVVLNGELLSDIARNYDVSLTALRWMNGLKPNAKLRPGRRLSLWHTYVLAAPHPDANPHVVERSLGSYSRYVSGLAAPSLTCERDGSISALSDGQYEKLAEARGWDFYVTVRGNEESLASVMARGRSQRRFIDEMKKFSEETGARRFVLEVNDPMLGAGARLQRACENLRQSLPRAKVVLSMAPLPRGWRGLATGFDGAKVAHSVDNILLDFHRWDRLLDRRGEPAPFSRMEQTLAQIMRDIPPWKVWLGIPMGGCHLSPRSGTPVGDATYGEVVRDGLRRGIRPGVDELGFLHMEGEEDARYVLQGRESLSRFLQLALRFKLSGLYLHAIGGEDRRLWDVLTHRIRTASSSRS